LVALEAAARRTRGENDIEAVHDLRVASRRLTSALWVWRDLLDKRSNHRLRRRLRRVRRAVGGMREREVESRMLRKLARSLAGPRRLAAQALATRLEKRIPSGAERAAKAVQRAQMLDIRTLLTRAVTPLSSNAVDAPRAFERARDVVNKLARKAHQALLDALASREDTLLHAARTAVKRWRYADECLTSANGKVELTARPVPGDRRSAGRPHAPAPGLSMAAATLCDLQNALGDIQDLAGLRARTARRAQRLRDRGQVAEADALLAAAATLVSKRAAPLAQVQRLVKAFGHGNTLVLTTHTDEIS